MPIFTFDNLKLLFIHIPKTGGTSVEESVSGYCKTSLLLHRVPDFLKNSPQHLTASNLKEIGFGPSLFDYSFAIVRNPYRRIESEYFYHLLLSEVQIRNTTKNIENCEINLSEIEKKIESEESPGKLHHIREKDTVLLKKKKYEVQLLDLKNDFSSLRDDEKSFSSWVLSNLSQYKADRYLRDNHFVPQVDFLDESIKEVFRFEDGVDKVIHRVSEVVKVNLPISHKLKTDKFPVLWSTEALALVREAYAEDFKKLGYDKNETP